jgi:hypothetical protein
MEPQSLRLVLHPEGVDGIGRHGGRRRDVGKRSAVRPPEVKGAVGLPVDLVALLMHGPMMAATLCRAPDYAD